MHQLRSVIMKSIAMIFFFATISSALNNISTPEILGAYVMQAAETSPVNFNGHTLLIQGVSGNTPGVYECCNCSTYGCAPSWSTSVGYSNCSSCESAPDCTDDKKKWFGSCAPQVIQLVDYATLDVLIPVIPGTEAMGFASATIHDNILYVYGTNLVNQTNNASQLWVFSSSDPLTVSSWTRKIAFVVPSSLSLDVGICNTNVHAVADAESQLRKHVMVIETGTADMGWRVWFAETNSTTPDRGWQVLGHPDTHTINTIRNGSSETACPSIRFFHGWYYVATTTVGSPCPLAFWNGFESNMLCVVVYRSKTLKYGSWEIGNEGNPIFSPVRKERQVHPAWTSISASERNAVYSGPKEYGDINDSDIDFCDTSDGNVLVVFAGIGNQLSNPYFNVAAIVKQKTTAQWLASYFPSVPTPAPAPSLVPLPPMGWMSWLRFLCETDCINHPLTCINENLYRDMGDTMVIGGFLAAGYDRVNVDDCWSMKKRNLLTGELEANKTRFSSGGLAGLAQYMKDRGLKLGAYGDQGVKTCAGYPGSKGMEDIDASAMWNRGIDYFFYDGCFPINSSSTTYPCTPVDMCYKEYIKGYTAMGRALQDQVQRMNSSKQMIYSCSWPAYLGDNEREKPWHLIHEAGCNLWRSWTDVTCTFQRAMFGSFDSILDHFANYSKFLATIAGPTRGWTDPDALVIGNGCLTEAEEETQMALFCMMAAPLIMGNDVRNLNPHGNSPRSKEILLNAYAIGVDQDPLGMPGYRVSPYSRYGTEVWARHLYGGDVAFVIVNKGDTEVNDTSLDLANMAMHGFVGGSDVTGNCGVFDVFKQKGIADNVTCGNGTIQFKHIEPHGVAFVIVSDRYTPWPF